MFSDLKYAIRQIWKHKGVTLAVMVSLALCIGMNALIFSALYAVALKPPPFRQPGQLVEIYNSYPKLGASHAMGTIPQYLDYAKHPELFAGVALFAQTSMTIEQDSGPARIYVNNVTPSFFSVLGVNPVAGSFFSPDAVTPGNDQYAVLAYPYWQSHFNSDPNAIGRKFRTGQISYTILGVAPPSVQYLNPRVSLFVPKSWSPRDYDDLSRNNTATAAGRLLVRLRPGLTLTQASAQVSAIDRGAYDSGSARYQRFVDQSGYQSVLSRLQDQQTTGQREVLYLLQAGALVVLLIGCVNVTNLLLARATARQPELSIRHALGGSRWHIVRQLMIESLLLSFLGGGLGAVLAASGGALVDRYAEGMLGNGDQFSVDPSLFVATVGISLLVGLVTGALPGFRAVRTNLLVGIQQSSRNSSHSRKSRAFGSALASCQVALSLALLVSTGLLIRSLVKAMAVPTGFDTKEITHGRIAPPAALFRNPAAANQLREHIVESLKEIPGVEGVGVSNYTPMLSAYHMVDVYIHGAGGGIETSHPLVNIMLVSGEYFTAMGIPVLSGRPFDLRDASPSALSVIIDRRMAQRYFPGQDPVGRQIAAYAQPTRDDQWATIIGVVNTVPYAGLDDSQGVPFVYLPIQFMGDGGLSFFVRSHRSSDELVPLMRQRIHAVDPSLYLYQTASLETIVDSSLDSRRSLLTLLGSFAAIALTLSAVGIYGVLAYDVSQRTREIGVRGAIGASRRQILHLILGQGLRTIGIGMGIGLIGAIWLGHFMAGMLFQVSPSDPPTLLLISLALVAIGMLASLVPAWRAARIDPVVALRAE